MLLRHAVDAMIYVAAAAIISITRGFAIAMPPFDFDADMLRHFAILIITTPPLHTLRYRAYWLPVCQKVHTSQHVNAGALCHVDIRYSPLYATPDVSLSDALIS